MQIKGPEDANIMQLHYIGNVEITTFDAHYVGIRFALANIMQLPYIGDWRLQHLMRIMWALDLH